MERDAESTYDYLVILSNTGGELSLNESRLALHEAKADKQKTSLLVTNGFATLFLVFHPYYATAFNSRADADEQLNGHLHADCRVSSTFAGPVRRLHCPCAGVSTR